MRMEGDKEFRIYCEDSKWPLGGDVIVTTGFGRMLSEASKRVQEELKKEPGYLDRLCEKFEKRAL